jgi:hypothetical protein
MSSRKTAASSASSWPISISIGADIAFDLRLLVRVAARDISCEIGRLWDIGLTDVQQDEHGLLCQEAGSRGSASAPSSPSSTSRSACPRAANGTIFSRTTSSRSLGFALGRRPVAPGKWRASRCVLSMTERSASTKLQVQLLDVAPRIHGSLRMGDGRILERADDVEQLVGGAQPRELIAGISAPHVRH